MGKKLKIMRGIPGSGKSRLAQDLCAQAHFEGKTCIILSTDTIISAVSNSGSYLYCKDYHGMAHELNQAKTREACRRGYDVIIVDNTNTTWREIRPYFEIAKEFGYEMELCSPSTEWANNPQECFNKTTHNVPLAAIEAMHKRFQDDRIIWRSAKAQNANQSNAEVPLPANPQVLNPCLPWAILVDLDGTLCLFDKNGDGPNCRNPYDASNCDEVDSPNEALEFILDCINQENFSLKEHGFWGEVTEIILMSGRDSKYRPQTERWLKKYSITYHALYMRAEGDRRKDSIVKRELFEQHIRGKFNVRVVFDDRDQVVKVWREELGLKCFQVAPGDF